MVSADSAGFISRLFSALTRRSVSVADKGVARDICAQQVVWNPQIGEVDGSADPKGAVAACCGSADSARVRIERMTVDRLVTKIHISL